MGVTVRSRVLGRLVPDGQRRTLPELTDELDLRHGDARAKQSAFWTMLTLSAVIAAAGVLADSTATVIGAMIIAPLSTPIMGIALSAVKGERLGSVRYVLLGALLVVTVGVGFSVVLPGGFDVSSNAQISGRTSPGLFDLTAALATGLAGAVALARRDVAAVLPGVAIAISLVPPLVVVGVCLGLGALLPALGALLLFLSNLLALVVAGMAVFAVLDYRQEAADARPVRRRRLILTVLMTAVLVPLAANSAVAYLVTGWTARVESAAQEWLADQPGAVVTGVELQGGTMLVSVLAPAELPPVEELLEALEGAVPDDLELVIDATVGQEVGAGPVGG